MAGAADAADTPDVDRVIDELYALDPDEFTAARNARAKELQAGGDKDAAASVKALAKPTVPAWALNQVARRHPEAVTGLLEAGAELRHAQEQALAGDGSALRNASRDEQARIADVVVAASAVLREAEKEPSAALVERMTATLRAAATDHAAGELLRAGRLTTDLSPAGFGLDELALTAPPRRSPAKPRDTTKAGTKEQVDRAEQEAIDRVRRAAVEAAAEADAAERAAVAAEAAAAEAEQDARAAEERARQLAHEARAARSAAAKARRAADAAASAAARLRS